MLRSKIFQFTCVLLLAACGQDPEAGNGSRQLETQATRPVTTSVTDPEKYSFQLRTRIVSPTKVEFTVVTDAPFPMNVSASITPAGLKDDETAFGSDIKVVTLREPTTKFMIDATWHGGGFEEPQPGQELPKGKYVAEVESFVDRDIAAPPQFSAHEYLQLGSSGDVAKVRERNARQRWVMGEMDYNRPWSDAELRSKLGRFERGRDSNGAFIYYFPDADVTLYVAPARQKVLTAKIGRIT